MSENRHLPANKNLPELPIHYRCLRQQRQVYTTYREIESSHHGPAHRVWPPRGHGYPIPPPPPFPVLPMYPPDAYYPPFIGLPVVPIPVLVPQPIPYFDSSQAPIHCEYQTWEFNSNFDSHDDLMSLRSLERSKEMVTRRPIKIEKPPEMLKNWNGDSSKQDLNPNFAEKADCVVTESETVPCDISVSDKQLPEFSFQNQHLSGGQEDSKMPPDEKKIEEPVEQKPATDEDISNESTTNKCNEGTLRKQSFRFIPTQARIPRSSEQVAGSLSKDRESSTSRTSSASCNSTEVGSTALPDKNLNESTESKDSKSSPSTPNTSAYFSSLDSTSSSINTPEVIIRRNPKRSYIDFSDNDQISPNNSFNSRSSYHSADRSFDESPAYKRTRWSETITPVRRDSGSFSNGITRCYSAGRYAHQPLDNGSAIQPQFIGYQLLGDSQFCRFGQQLLGLQRVPCPNSPGRIGICVSGQTIKDLHERIKENFYPLSDKVILMIGTNDFLRNHTPDVTEMCNKLSALVKTLQETVTNIVLLTLPPIPKLERQFKAQHFVMLHKYNSHIRSLACGDKLRIGDISPMYMTDFPYQKCRMNLFELCFSNSSRPDLIHLNRQGLEVIKRCGIVILRLKIFVTIVLFQTEDLLKSGVESEVRDYAVKIGINPDTEKHLLNIALDGLMTPLPSDWKACLDERSNHIFYFNSKLQKTQWNHPLDQHFENIVRQKRLDESISAGDDDSKTSIKEDLKSFEEAATTSDMISSRHPLDSHKSRLSTGSSKNTLQPMKDASPDGRKVLNPLGRPPLPPKRRPGSGSVSPKRGSSLSLRLGTTPAPARIDIDSLGVPLGLPSPEPKSDKVSAVSQRAAGIKLTGGGSAFLKSNQKQSPSPSEESKPTLDDPLFEIVREAESLDSPEDENGKSREETRLKHSVSLGESGFDRLTKSKRFASLQESLLSLKLEMDVSSNDGKSPNTSVPSGLRGILREKPSPTTKLWDIDPALLTNEEKERLRVQEMKEERKQNVRFADIVNKPIKIHFSKSDSEDDSNMNDSSNDLDDLILEQVYSDEELKKESKDLDDSLRADEDENGLQAHSTSTDENLLNRKESNKIILSRLADLDKETGRLDDKVERKSRTVEIFNNNKDDSEDWLTGKQNVINQNEQKVHKLRAKIFDNSSLLFDAENNPIDSDKNISENFAKSLANKDNLKSAFLPPSPNKQTLSLEALEHEGFGSGKKKSPSPRLSSAKSVFLRGDSGEDSPGEFHKSKLMPEMDLQKVFDSVRESIKQSVEEGGDGEEEPMQMSPAGGDDVETEVSKTEAEDRQQRRTRKIEDHQRRQLEEKRATLQHEFEESLDEIKEEFKRQESIERQRLYMEVQQSVSKYKELIDKEKNERETQLRNDCEDFIKQLEEMLSKEKEEQVKRLKDDHEKYLQEHKCKISQEKEQFEMETQMRLQTSSSQLEKIMLEFKQKEDAEINRLIEEKNKRLEEIRVQIESEQAEKEKKHKEELSIVEAEYERVLADKRSEVEKIQLERQVEVAALRSQQEDTVSQIMDQHRQAVKKLQDQCHMEEEYLRRKHAEKMDALNTQLNKASEKEDFTQVNREFEKVRCEKRLLEDKYKSLKEKYLRLKNEVRLSMERKRQAKMNRQLQQRDPSTTEDTTDRSTDHSKPPLTRRKLGTNLSPETEAGGETQKTIKRRPKLSPSLTTSSSSAANPAVPPAKPKNVWIPSPQQRREGVSSAEDNHTSVSEEIQMEEDCVPKWTQSALTPLENLRKQLEKLDDLEEQFPNSVHADTYLRYPFSGPAGGSCELDFYRHRLHLERESVKRAKQAVAEQRLNIEHRQVQLRHRQHTETLHQLHQEERELTDMEVNLHRTRALLGEKIIRLRHLEQSIERAAAYTPAHTHTYAHSSADTTNTDSSGFSGSDLDLSTVGHNLTGRQDMFWTENVLHSLENINGEIREIWSILGKQQVPGLGPPPMLSYENRDISQGGMDIHHLEPHRATDIADRTRKLKEWLIRTRDQQTRVIAPVNL